MDNARAVEFALMPFTNAACAKTVNPIVRIVLTISTCIGVTCARRTFAAVVFRRLPALVARSFAAPIAYPILNSLIALIARRCIAIGVWKDFPIATCATSTIVVVPAKSLIVNVVIVSTALIAWNLSFAKYAMISYVECVVGILVLNAKRTFGKCCPLRRSFPCARGANSYLDAHPFLRSNSGIVARRAANQSVAVSAESGFATTVNTVMVPQKQVGVVSTVSGKRVFLICTRAAKTTKKEIFAPIVP